MSQGKAGLLGGVVVALGIGLARFGDNCASAGLRGARMADDVAAGGAAARRVSWGADDAARLGRGIEDPVHLGRGADDMLQGVRGASVHEAGAARAFEGTWSETLLDAGLDLGVELVDADFGEVLPTVLSEGTVRCPSIRDVVGGSAEWNSLLDGLGVGCAPVVVVGMARADGRSLGMGAEQTPLTELARRCVAVKARCIFVGCPVQSAEACLQDTRSTLHGTELQPSLAGYVRGFVGRVIEQPSPPQVIAQLAPGDDGVRLVVARPGGER